MSTAGDTMTLDNDSWSRYFDSLGGCAERLKAAVTLARVPLSPARAGRQGASALTGGLLEAIRFDAGRDEIEVAICQNGAAGASLRYFVPAPRSVAVDDSSLSKVITITDAEGVRTLISIASLDAEFDRCVRTDAVQAAT
jgi:hypothetical protein